MNNTGTIPNTLVSITDTSFSKEKAGNYLLIITTQPTQIALALYLPKENKFTALHEFKVAGYSTVSEIIEKAGYSKCSFGKVILTVVTPISSLLPSSLVKENKLKKLLGLNHSIKEDKIFIDELTNSDIAQVYQPDSTYVKAIKAQFPQTEVKHFSSALLDNLLNSHKQNKKQTAWIYLHTNQFQLILFNNSKLIFSNWFEYSSNEDILYYLLYTLEQLQFENEKMVLNILGQLKKEAELVSIIKQYIPEVKFADDVPTTHFTAPFKQIDVSSYYGIFCQPLNSI